MIKKITLIVALSICFYSVAQDCEQTPLNGTAALITENAATLTWDEPLPSPAMGYEYFLSNNPSTPTEDTTPTGTTGAGANVIIVTGLVCYTPYFFFVRSNCGGGVVSEWSESIPFSTMFCMGYLPPAVLCDSDGDGLEILDLEQQRTDLLEYLNTPLNILTFHLTAQEAYDDVNPISVNMPVNQIGTAVYVRSESADVPGQFEMYTFQSYVLMMPEIDSIPPVYECDADGDGFATFDLSATYGYIANNSGIDLTVVGVGFFQTLSDAQTNTNPVNYIYTNIAINPVLFVRINNGNCFIIREVNLVPVTCTGIRFIAFADMNGNGTKEAGEANFPSGEFSYELNGEISINNITVNNGTLEIVDGNFSNSYDVTYTINPEVAEYFSLTISEYNNIALPAEGIDTYYFPVIVIEAYNDLSVALIPGDAPRPGFSHTIALQYSNHSPNVVSSGIITFIKDPLATITGTSEGAAALNPTGFTFDFTDLQPFESRSIGITMQVPVIPTVQLGDSLVNHVSIQPDNDDATPENNTAIISQVIVGSFDPNDKMESHGERILFSDFTSEDYLYYTIRFENTGTASAINVEISDLLDGALDPSSVRMVSASHDYVLTRNENQLTWKFSNIILPYSAMDPEGSQGYVQFKVKPNAGYEIGDIIPNSASIFFDFNPAIVTNTFTTEFVETLGVGENQSLTLKVYPNPASEIVTISAGDSGLISSIVLYDMLGKQILSKTSEGLQSDTIDISSAGTGWYFVEISTSDDQKVIKKLIIR